MHHCDPSSFDEDVIRQDWLELDFRHISHLDLRELLLYIREIALNSLDVTSMRASTDNLMHHGLAMQKILHYRRMGEIQPHYEPFLRKMDDLLLRTDLVGMSPTERTRTLQLVEHDRRALLHLAVYDEGA